MINNRAKKRIQLSAASSVLLHILVLSLGITSSLLAKQRFKSTEAIVVNTHPQPVPPLSSQFQSQNNAFGGGTTEKPNKIIRSFTQYARKNHVGTSKKEEKAATKTERTDSRITSTQSIDVVFITQAPHRTVQNNSTGKQTVHREILLQQLKAQLHRLIQKENTDKKRLFIGITARKTAHAQYTNAIAEKIEKIGTQHFPDEAKKKPFKLIVTISIRQTGTLEHIQIERSSGSPTLDQAACDLIQKAFPAKPFPPSISREYFAIDMTRTIYFDPQEGEKEEHPEDPNNHLR